MHVSYLLKLHEEIATYVSPTGTSEKSINFGNADVFNTGNACIGTTKLSSPC